MDQLAGLRYSFLGPHASACLVGHYRPRGEILSAELIEHLDVEVSDFEAFVLNGTSRFRVRQNDEDG